MAWIPVAISIVASDTSALTLLGNPGYTFSHDLRIVFYVFGYSAAAWLVIWLFLPFYCRLPIVTAYEYLERRFDIRIRATTSFLFLVIRSAHVAIAMYAPATILALITGLPLTGCVLTMGLATTIYSTLGGIRAVIWTDVLQFSIVTGAVACTFIVAIGKVQGGITAIWHVGEQFGRWRLWDFSFQSSSETSFWATFIGGTVAALATIGTDQAVLQRYFTAKSEEECRNSLKAFSIFVVPFNLMLFLLGGFLFAFYQQHPNQLHGLPSADAVLGFFAVHELPEVVASLLIGAIVAASMGVMSAGINSLSTCLVVDFYKRLLVAHASDAHYLKAGRISTILWGAVTTFGALYAGRLGALALAFPKVQGFVGGVMLGIFLLAMLSSRATGTGAMLGAVVGLGIVSYVAFMTNISVFWYSVVGSMATVTAGYTLSVIVSKEQAVDRSLLRASVASSAGHSRGKSG